MPAKYGYSVPSVASSGSEAIKEVEDKSPDLVLMDIVLKGEMDGIETAMQIRSRFNIRLYISQLILMKRSCNVQRSQSIWVCYQTFQ